MTSHGDRSNRRVGNLLAHAVDHTRWKPRGQEKLPTLHSVQSFLLSLALPFALAIFLRNVNEFCYDVGALMKC